MVSEEGKSQRHPEPPRRGSRIGLGTAADKRFVADGTMLWKLRPQPEGQQWSGSQNHSQICRPIACVSSSRCSRDSLSALCLTGGNGIIRFPNYNAGLYFLGQFQDLFCNRPGEVQPLGLVFHSKVECNHLRMVFVLTGY